MTRIRSLWLPALVLALTVAGLFAASQSTADQFADKAWSLRLVAYPLLMLVAPTIWWFAVGRRDRSSRPPALAFTLIMAPFLSDLTANWLDLFRSVDWWDDLSHFAHWLLLCWGIGLLLAPHVRPRWVLVPLIAGIGALLALGWELGEWYAFIRHGKEASGAYQDTLGDLTLGTSGALLAGVLTTLAPTTVTTTARAQRGRGGDS